MRSTAPRTSSRAQRIAQRLGQWLARGSRFAGGLATAALVGILSSGCGDEAPRGDTCVADEDCPTGLFCVLGTCADPFGTGLEDAADRPTCPSEPCADERFAIPRDVRASSDRSDGVRVQWSAVEGASGYHVERDGERATSNRVTSLSWLDTEVAAGSWPSTFAEVDATQGLPDRVRVTWSLGAGEPGPEHVYRVTAVVDGEETLPSFEARGRRAAPTATAFDVEVDGAWVQAESSGGFDDLSAPPPRLLAGWAEASTDREDGVLLTARGFLTQLGAPRSYRVRVRPDGGGGEPVSEVVTGSREAPPGSVAIRWQFLPADGPGEWVELAGATGREHLDTTVGRGAGRVYRAEVSLYETTRATDRVVGQRR